MVQIYYLGEGGEELEALTIPDIEKLGLEYHQLNPEDYEEQLSQIKTKNNYTYFDIIHCSPEHLPDFENKVKHFAEECATFLLQLTRIGTYTGTTKFVSFWKELDSLM
jgi:hypothetical protein